MNVAGANDEMAVELSGITKRFPGVVANYDVSLRVRRGTIHAIVGENGAGKSTLMKTLYGMHQPDEGRIVVNGSEIEFRSPTDAIAVGIGMVHQHFKLADNLTILENIILGDEPVGGRGRIKFGEARQRITELARTIGVDFDPDTMVGELGVGQRQRVEILKVLYRGANILILDEPTSGLDPNQVLDIRQLITALGKEKTVMLSTHIMQEVEAICDRVVIINKGQKVADDRLENLRSQSAGTQTVRIQFASPVQEAFLQQLGEDVQLTALGDNRWRLSSADPNLRQRSSQFALKHNLEVLELAAERNSLEEIFQTLTRRVDDI